MVRAHRSSRSTSFPVLVAVNGSIDLVLVVANTFFDTVDLIQHSSTPSPSKRQEADTMSKPPFFHAIDNRASNVTIKDVYEAEDVSHGTGEIHECQIMHDRLCILQEDNDPSHGTRSAHNVERRYKLAS